MVHVLRLHGIPLGFVSEGILQGSWHFSKSHSPFWRTWGSILHSMCPRWNPLSRVVPFILFFPACISSHFPGGQCGLTFCRGTTLLTYSSFWVIGSVPLKTCSILLLIPNCCRSLYGNASFPFSGKTFWDRPLEQVSTCTLLINWLIQGEIRATIFK